MTERTVFRLQTGKMGSLCVASLASLGISAIGATREDALVGIAKALQTHSIAKNQTGAVAGTDDCEVSN
jgi:hypothetical protein